MSCFSSVSTGAMCCFSCRRSDYIAVYEEIGQKNNFTLTERYCSKDFLPGPYATRNVVKLIFRSNEKDSNVGFKASFKFVPVLELQQRECLVPINCNVHPTPPHTNLPLLFLFYLFLFIFYVKFQEI